MKRKKMKKKILKTRKKKRINRFNIKTFFFDMTKIKKPEEIDDRVNEFLNKSNVKEAGDITIEKDEQFLKISVIFKVKVIKV